MPADGLISIKELADGVNQWCFDHGVIPTNGQEGERITERNIRFYRTRELLDAPGSEGGEHKRGFSPKHVAQLRAIRLLQARAVPLEGIRAALQGRSLTELQELERAELRRLNDAGVALGVGSAHESWQVTAVGGEYLLVSRRGRSVSDEQRRQIAQVLGVRAEG